MDGKELSRRLKLQHSIIDYSISADFRKAVDAKCDEVYQSLKESNAGIQEIDNLYANYAIRCQKMLKTEKQIYKLAELGNMKRAVEMEVSVRPEMIEAHGIERGISLYESMNVVLKQNGDADARYRATAQTATRPAEQIDVGKWAIRGLRIAHLAFRAFMAGR